MKEWDQIMKMHKIILLIFVLALGATLSSCTAQAQPQSLVEIRDFSFQPGTLTVTAGTTVNWINNDGTYHTITADNGEFDSGPLMSGDQVGLTFSEPGSYPYHCSIHPSMQGEIMVVGREAYGASGAMAASFPTAAPAAARAGAQPYPEPYSPGAPAAQSSYPAAMNQMTSLASYLDLVVVPYPPLECRTPPKKPATVLIMSKKVKGYDVFVDGAYETTEGLTGPVDGSLTIHVTGDQFHTIAISKGEYVNSDCRFFVKGRYYYITL